MAYVLASEHSTTAEMHVVLTADKTVGQAEVLTSKLGFYQGGGKNGETVTFIYQAKRIICDCDSSLTYNAGDAVYDAGTPTGTVNKTSTAGRRLVGYCLKTYPANTSKIEVEVFDGLRAPV